jgi:DNA-binding response OmpR family regulator
MSAATILVVDDAAGRLHGLPALRASEETAMLPVIMLTASTGAMTQS